MPTGYTSKLYEGEPQTFPEFALSCARAFGALITMRDDAMDAPIPDEFQPSSYHQERLAEAEARLVELERLDIRECAARSLAEYEQAQKARDDSAQKKAELKARYEAMLRDVQAWRPPTPEHIEMKKFMAQQLTESIDFDCSMDFWPEVEHLSPEVWRERKIGKARDDIAYHGQHHREEVERAESRTAWVQALRASLAS